ncbi:unnamed protein product [Merluccius merluccius]
MVTVTEHQNQLNDTMGKNSAEGAPPVLSVVVSLAVVMASIVIVALICLRKLWRRRELDQAVRVIYEVSHRDLEVEPDQDGASTSSSQGSSQWTFEGHGTMVTVTKRQNQLNDTMGKNSAEGAPPVLSVVVSLAVVTASIVIVALICLRKLWRRRELDQAVRVIDEVSHRDLEVEPDQDGASTSSSQGSSQWVTIDIPCLKTFEGNGTMVTVTERQNRLNDTMEKNSAEGAPPVLSVVVSLAVVMASIVIVALICLRKLWRRRELDQAVRVIYEVSHRDSEVDGASTSSSQGSSQWMSATMSQVETAMALLLQTFDQYAGTEGKKDTLTKAELMNLMEKEMPAMMKVAKDPDAVGKLMNDLDHDKDSEVDFQEFMVLIAALTCACHALCPSK